MSSGAQIQQQKQYNNVVVSRHWIKSSDIRENHHVTVCEAMRARKTPAHKLFSVYIQFQYGSLWHGAAKK